VRASHSLSILWHARDDQAAYIYPVLVTPGPRCGANRGTRGPGSVRAPARAGSGPRTSSGRSSRSRSWAGICRTSATCSRRRARYPVARSCPPARPAARGATLRHLSLLPPRADRRDPAASGSGIARGRSKVTAWTS
jgi:hypothetical protein